MINRFFLIILFVVLSKAVFSQEKIAFLFSASQAPLEEVLIAAEDLYGVRFSYIEKTIESKYITLESKKRTLPEMLRSITKQADLSFTFLSKRYIIILPKSKQENPGFSKIQQLESVVLFGYLTKGIIKNKGGSFVLKPKKQGILAGLVEADVLESIQQLPGVISPNETATGFTVRGGNTDQNRIIWNGINIYHKGHLFGMLSAFNPSITQEVLFYNKGTPPQYGERISSVIDLTSNNYVKNKVTIGAGINGINTDFYAEIPILKNKVSVQLATRRSYTENLTFKKLAQKVFQTTKIANAVNKTNDFSFSDYTFKIIAEPTENSLITVNGIFIDNTLDFLVFEENGTKALNDILETKNEGYGIRWDKSWRNLQLISNAFVSKYRLTYNFIERDGNQNVSDFEKKNVIYDSGFSTRLIIKGGNNKTYSVGYDYNLKDVGYSFIKKVTSTFILDLDKTLVSNHALFGNYKFEKKNSFDGSIGVRVNYYPELQSVRIEPRIIFYKKLFDNLKLQMSGEIKNQVINEIDETVFSNFSLENKLWRLANNKTFPIINSVQVSGGLIYQNKGWSIDVDGYIKRINGITALSLGFLNTIDSGFYTGNQDILGLDFYLKKNFKNINTWLSYTFNDIKNKYDGLNDERYFTSNINIKHFFTASVLYKYKKFETALAWHWNSGKPYTKAIRENLTIVGFTGINTETLPSYNRVDFSSTYRFNILKRAKIKGEVGVSIRNIFNRKNLLSKEYTGNNSINDAITEVDKFSLGFTPNFMMRVKF